MNKKRWSHAGVPMAVLALKLSEEAAEVGTEITDALMDGIEWDAEKVVEECDHVIFIAQRIRSRAELAANTD